MRHRTLPRARHARGRQSCGCRTAGRSPARAQIQHLGIECACVSKALGYCWKKKHLRVVVGDRVEQGAPPIAGLEFCTRITCCMERCNDATQASSRGLGARALKRGSGIMITMLLVCAPSKDFVSPAGGVPAHIMLVSS